MDSMIRKERNSLLKNLTIKTFGLHPLDVRVLLGVFQALLDHGATVIVIEHDLDMIRNADYVIDMGSGGGDAGGRIIATGTPQKIRITKTALPEDICKLQTGGAGIVPAPPVAVCRQYKTE